MPRDVLETIAAAQEAAALLDARTREAHAAAKDLRAAMREHDQLVRTAVRETMETAMTAAANVAAEGATADFALLVRKAEAAMLRRLDAIYTLYLEGERDSPEAFSVLMERRQAIRKGIAAADADRAASGHPDHQPDA